MIRLTTFTDNEHVTLPRAKYATPEERVYKTAHAVRAVTMMFV